MGNPPGRYQIELDGKQPILHKRDGALLEDQIFDATAGWESLFTFEIVNLDLPFRFSQPPGPQPIDWFSAGNPIEQPPHIHHEVREEGTVLDLKVNPPNPLPPENEFRFVFNFENGEGLDPLDPTIVEKPPDQ